MDINDVVQLAKAGFTAEEIKAFAGAGKSAPETPEPAPVEKPVETVGTTAPETPDFSAAMAPVIKQLSDLTKLIQANAIINSDNGGNPQPSVDDALAAIINGNK